MIRAVLLLLLFPILATAAEPADVKTTWRLLDYMAVDYRGAVQGGQVLNPDEYAEMRDFADTVRRQLEALPDHEARASLVAGAVELQNAIAARAEPADVARVARRLGEQLLAAFPVPLSPRQTPDLARGQALYTEHCAACHGSVGAGDGPLARQFDPPPVAFTEASRARERSLFALYQVVTQGLDGTAMPGFARLSDADRWALAFVVGQFAYPQAAEGEVRWTADATLRAAVPDMAALTTLTPSALAAKVGETEAPLLMAYLRRHPQAVVPSTSRVLKRAHERLDAALDAYRRGQAAQATQLAVSAYLDGFEPVEPQLAARDPVLLRAIEVQMTALRGELGAAAPVEDVEAHIRALQAKLEQAGGRLQTDADAASAFAGAFTILLREGLEALLIVVAMIAFLRKAQRTDVLRYVHGGTSAALLAGVATWAVATYLVDISGASRELTEGLASLFAAVVLLFVGIWMHGKSQAGAWQQYIKQKVGAALSQRSGWFLFVLAFVVVYREVFETILFYVALWAQGHHHAVLAGAMAAAVALAAISALLLGASRRLPIGLFFSISALLMALLAVVLTGKGVAALQEADLLSTRLLSLPRIDLLGLYPTVQGISAQLACMAVLVAGFLYNRRVALPAPA